MSATNAQGSQQENGEENLLDIYLIGKTVKNMNPNLSSAIQVQPLFREIEKGVFKVRSKSHPKCSHTVRTEAHGITCNCPARVKCWHIKEIEKFIGIKAPKPVSAEAKSIGDRFMEMIEADDRELLRSHGLKVAA